MKKIWMKRLTVLGCILLAVGILISGGSFVAMGFSLDAFNGPQYKTSAPESYTFTGDPVTSIDMETSTQTLVVEGVAGLKVPELTISPSRLEYAVENGTLTVREKSGWRDGNWKWYRLININTDDSNKAILRVPEDFSGALRLKSSFGSIKISNCRSLQSLQVDSQNETFRLSETTVSGAASIKAAFGDVKLEHFTADSITLRSENGGVKLNNCSSPEAEFTMSFGDLRIEDSSIDSLTMSNGNGGIRLNGVEAKDSLNSHTTFGDLRFENVTCPKVKLRTDNGGIRGTLNGAKQDYRISANVTYGDTNLSGQLNGRYTLEVESEFGDVKIDFTEE